MKRTFKLAAMLFAVVAISTGCHKENKENNDGGGTITNHNWVDLGLPSGTLWATCNVGANTPEEYGDYFGQENGYHFSPMDEATANWGSQWKTPTVEQWNELIHFTTRINAIQNNVNGRQFTSANGNSLFLPAAGIRKNDSGELSGVGTSGYYWSSTRDLDYPHNPKYLNFWEIFCQIKCSPNYSFCNNGLPVRPVRAN